jgi:hypothetical protein
MNIKWLQSLGNRFDESLRLGNDTLQPFQVVGALRMP